MVTPQVTNLAALLVPQSSLAPYDARTPDRVVVATWVPKDGNGSVIVRKDLIEGYQVRYGGSTPKKAVDALVDRVYSHFEEKLLRQNPYFQSQYQRAPPQILTPGDADIECEEPVARPSGYGSKLLQRHAA